MTDRIHPTALVSPKAEIGEGTSIGPYAIIEDDVKIGPDNRILAHAFVGRHTTLGRGNVIHPFATIGHEPQDKGYHPEIRSRTIIGNENIFRESCSIHRGSRDDSDTVLGSRGYYMANSHVAHDCQVGDDVIIVNNSSIAGHCSLGNGAIISGNSTMHQFCRIGRLTMLSGVSATNLDLPPFLIFVGRPASCQGLNRIGMKRNGIEPAARKEIKTAFRWLYREGLPLNEALDRIEQELSSAEACELLAFCRESKRGIARKAGGGPQDAALDF